MRPSSPFSPSVHLLLQVVWLKASGFCYATDNGLSLGPLGYPVVVPCHGDPAVLDLYVQPLHIFQQFTDSVTIRVGQLIVLVPDLGDSWVGQLSSFPSLPLPQEALQCCLNHSPSAAYSKVPSCAPALRPSGPGPPHSYHQGQLDCFQGQDAELPLLIALRGIQAPPPFNALNKFINLDSLCHKTIFLVFEERSHLPHSTMKGIVLLNY